MHAILYLIALFMALAGVAGALYWFFEMATQLALTTLVAGLLSAAVFWALGFIISQLYDVNRKLDKGSGDRKAAQQ